MTNTHAPSSFCTAGSAPCACGAGPNSHQGCAHAVAASIPRTAGYYASRAEEVPGAPGTFHAVPDLPFGHGSPPSAGVFVSGGYRLDPPLPRGCICPPGAEAGCQGATCPRVARDALGGPSPDRVRELLEANTREVERRREAQAEIVRLMARCDRYGAALLLIRDAHVPDQPAAMDMLEREWVMRHVAALRRAAMLALDPDRAPAPPDPAA